MRDIPPLKFKKRMYVFWWRVSKPEAPLRTSATSAILCVKWLITMNVKIVPLMLTLTTGCSVLRPEPMIQVRTDTVTVTQSVEAPLPEGTPVEVCLSTGVTAQIHIAANGDTLVGEKRVRIRDLRPAVNFVGVYAHDRDWYLRGDVIPFERRNYRRAGVERVRACDELKLVGAHQGVPLFAEVTAPPVLPALIVPIRPGVFQDYLRVR